MDNSSAALSGTLQGLTDRYRALTHNLANANTVGFKKRRSLFAEMLADKDSESQGGVGAGVEQTSVIDHTQGAAVQTGRALDLCLTGNVFFALDTPGGRLYTRGGAFHVNANRQLVDFAGRMVAGQAGPITLPAGAGPSDVTVSREGRLTARGASVGQLEITQFERRDLLKPVGGNAFIAPDDAGPAQAEAADFSVQQGFQEGSNVTVVEELVDLITVTRLYEANLKSLTKQDDSMEHILRVAMA